MSRGESGQISIEAIIIFGMFVIILIGISFPVALKTQSASNDAAIILEARKNLNTIVSTIETVRAQGSGAVTTVAITSNSAKWQINTNAPAGENVINPYPSSPVLGYEISIWSSNAEVPKQLYRIRSGYGALAVFNISGISNGPSGQRTCNFDGNGKGTWNIRVENNATTAMPYLNFTCTASSSTIVIRLTG